MKIWTTEEEAAELRNRFAGVNRAAFARQHSIAGGQAMIYQHINGLRPMSMEAAIAYAQAFKCDLQEISPRLAQEASRVAAMAGDREGRASEPASPTWPLGALTPERYDRLPELVKGRIIERAISIAEEWETSTTKSPPEGKAAA